VIQIFLFHKNRNTVQARVRVVGSLGLTAPPPLLTEDRPKEGTDVIVWRCE